MVYEAPSPTTLITGDPRTIAKVTATAADAAAAAVGICDAKGAAISPDEWGQGGGVGHRGERGGGDSQGPWVVAASCATTTIAATAGGGATVDTPYCVGW